MGACQCHPLTSSSPCFFRAASPPQSLLALVHDGDDGDDDDEGERRARPVRAGGQTAGGRRARRIGHGRATIDVSSVIFPPLTCSPCKAMATTTCDARTPRARRGQRARRRTRRSSQLDGPRTTPLTRRSPSSDATTSTRICDDDACSSTSKPARHAGGL